MNPVPSRDRKVVRRWELPGDPRGLAIGADGTIYVGLAESQSVVAVNAESGAIKKRVVLDSADIAATKELVTLRTNAQRTRLYVANGSDESATILSLPDLGVLREITREGETIRDIAPDPKNRYLYVLGRKVYVYDFDGRTLLRTIDINDPQAIAVSPGGAMVSVMASESFNGTKATFVTMLSTKSFEQTSREPLQTTKTIESALFSPKDKSFVAMSNDTLFERSTNAGAKINGRSACLPTQAGPQIAAFVSDDEVVYAERRCSSSGAFNSTESGVKPASLYGVDAYAIAFDAKSNTIVATDRAGFLTIYSVPRAAVAE